MSSGKEQERKQEIPVVLAWPSVMTEGIVGPIGGCFAKLETTSSTDA